MTNLSQIIETVTNASTYTEQGRHQVANGCKELYHAIEADVIIADKEWMLQGLYSDLFHGNFNEPFMCEKKKETFTTVIAIYNQRVVPYL